MTDLSDRWGANESTGVSHAGLLTKYQIRCMEELPTGHELLRVRGRTPVVREPDGQLSRIGPSGRLVAISPVSGVRSYLDVRG